MVRSNPAVLKRAVVDKGSFGHRLSSVHVPIKRLVAKDGVRVARGILSNAHDEQTVRELGVLAAGIAPHLRLPMLCNRFGADEKITAPFIQRRNVFHESQYASRGAACQLK